MSSCERCGERRVPGTLHVCDDRAPLLRLRQSPAASSTGIGRIVVGYRPDHRLVLENRRVFGIEPQLVRRCYSCGSPVLFYSGGVDAVSERDAEVVCTVCKSEHYSELVAAL